MEESKIIKATAHYNTALHVRESKPGQPASRKIYGYAILFNTLSAPLWSDGEEEAREVIAPGAITKGLLDKSDIKMTMFHDRQLILARSKSGKGTLKYGIDKKGVYFEFEAPKTANGDEALELVKRGDICGCSFAFTTYYRNTDYVKRSTRKANGKLQIIYRVEKVTGIYDFTLAADPAYPDTSVEARELVKELREKRVNNQVEQMRDMAEASILGPTIKGTGNKNGWKNQVRAMRKHLKS